MLKGARIPSSISTSDVSVEKSKAAGKSDHHELVSIALFAGCGLLISLVAMLLGVQGAWF